MELFYVSINSMSVIPRCWYDDNERLCAMEFRLRVKNSAVCGTRTRLVKASGALKPLVPGRVAQSVGHLTRKSGVLGSIPGLATYFRFSFRFFKKGSCQLLAKVCARSTG